MPDQADSALPRMALATAASRERIPEVSAAPMRAEYFSFDDMMFFMEHPVPIALGLGSVPVGVCRTVA